MQSERSDARRTFSCCERVDETINDHDNDYGTRAQFLLSTKHVYIGRNPSISQDGQSAVEGEVRKHLGEFTRRVFL